MRAFVLDKNKQPLMPCSLARARELLAMGKATVYRMYPFTILLFEREGGDTQEIELKIDPGSKTTGMALVGAFKNGRKVIGGLRLKHRGLSIKASLEARRAIRRARRSRKTRYRQARFKNRRRRDGWLAPSLRSRIDNICHWVRKIKDFFAPISSLCMELVSFDTQKMQNPDISGVEYRQGTLQGYEIREYLLRKWQYSCAYGGATKTRLEIDHIKPRSQGGSDRLSKLILCCRNCNQRKGSSTLKELLSNQTSRLAMIAAKLQQPLADAAAVNSAKQFLQQSLSTISLPLTCWSAAQTHHNRFNQNLEKDHWIDAACVGNTGSNLKIPKSLSVLEIEATGRGSRQMQRMSRYGFPRTAAKSQKQVCKFQTGDIVRAKVPSGKKCGTHTERVAIRETGNFNIKTKTGTIEGVHARYCHLLHKVDGYFYNYYKRSEISSQS